MVKAMEDDSQIAIPGSLTSGKHSYVATLHVLLHMPGMEEIEDNVSVPKFKSARRFVSGSVHGISNLGETLAAKSQRNHNSYHGFWALSRATRCTGAHLRVPFFVITLKSMRSTLSARLERLSLPKSAIARARPKYAVKTYRMICISAPALMMREAYC